jgi:hypothetical protein
MVHGYMKFTMCTPQFYSEKPTMLNSLDWKNPSARLQAAAAFAIHMMEWISPMASYARTL